MAADTDTPEFAVADALAAAAPIERIFVGYSGGSDSTALLAATRAVANQPVVALHFDHGLAAEAQDWVAHCRSTCSALDVELIVGHNTDSQEAGPNNPEARARAARYDFFACHVAAADVLLLAHHAGDQTETALMRLFSGRGLIGMRTATQRHDLRILRPLLTLPRGALESYAGVRGLSWVEDPSNTDTRFDRNYVRHELLPRISARWPQVDAAVARVVASHRAVDEALAHVLASLPDQVDLASLPSAPASRAAWLRAYLTTRGEHQVSDRALAAWLDDLDRDRVEHPTLVGRKGTLRAYDGALYFEPLSATPAGVPAAVALTVDGPEVAFGGWTLSCRRVQPESPLAFAATGPITVRPRVGGERLRRGDDSRAVKQILQEARVPPWRRQYYPLIFVGDALVGVPHLAAHPAAAGQPACVVDCRWRGA